MTSKTNIQMLRKTAVITKIDSCKYYGNYNKLELYSYGRPASSNSDVDEALAYALRCVQQESLTLNEHFRDIFLYFSLTIMVCFTIQFTISVDMPTYNVSQASFFPFVLLEKNRPGNEACLHLEVILVSK